MTAGASWPVDPAYEPLGGARDLTHRDADWSGLVVEVVGLGVSGFAAAVALAERGAQVSVLSPARSEEITDREKILAILEASVRYGELPAGPSEGTQLVVTSPGFAPSTPYLMAAQAAGIPVWGEVELAWRMRAREGAAPWLTVTGTNGKTTAVTMLESILRAAGKRTTAAGNVGLPIIEAVLDPAGYEVIAVELSTFQLHWSRSISALASCCLNVAPDHIDWHGSFEEYRRMKGRVYDRTQVACIYNHDDPTTEQLVEDAEVVEGCRAVGFTLKVPHPSMLGIVEDVLADRAFVADRQRNAAELCQVKDLGQEGAPPAPHYVADALAAAALARAYGVPPLAVRDGLRSYHPQPHRISPVGEVDGVRYVDDSKATNPPAARASLLAYDQVVWVAGGLLKGADVDDLVAAAAPRLRAVVLIGRDRAQIAEAVHRHAPDVPVIDIERTDTGAMHEAVRAAASQARPGDVVLLAPAAASLDMFASYGARGDAFADAVRALDDDRRT
ncbi:UDP-N-acetylmuramoyl-L-alanine--D-glutamate ligase [Calidifontibacter sp. DB0510]|uniref:UDP-N-acetylmuramoylalanine--D-glutamate ligase n=1 Tax=Metallococcus carri TaxID=1656884 RepID=A0A967B795_9MICO|nr:UDP-N-acetylmuramoyl-L-alanine--D-glutamate ligase [Metallococcus carri]NHN56036.1 UDP-N-acetylmuramoyl-L-alanine--D-glutamate ligase [Metallococcus carri]NOP37507.1 UDP-N-acetylmuramoyl-L-alanine--D-glutamate ligase [Calidifontibacter sp. DB2511S]